MAEFIPNINLPVEAVEHARWLQKRAVKQESFNDEVRRFMARSDKSTSAGARQTTVINNRVTNTRNSIPTGLPAGGTEGMRLGKLSDGDYDADWVENTLGGMKQQYFDVDADGSETSLLTEYEPHLFEFNITSAAPNSPYSILFPDMFDFTRDLALAFYVLSINVFGDSVDLELNAASVPTYFDHPDVTIMGAPMVADSGTVTLPDGFQGQWFVLCNFPAGTSRAIPLVDPYHAATFGPAVSAGSTAPTVATTAAAGTGATASVTQGTSLSGVVELVTGTSPTTTGWGELLTFTSGWSDPPVLALYPANQAAAALKHYGAISGVEAEAHFDLTGIAASITYRFHYSLLPSVAV